MMLQQVQICYHVPMAESSNSPLQDHQLSRWETFSPTAGLLSSLPLPKNKISASLSLRLCGSAREYSLPDGVCNPVRNVLLSKKWQSGGQGRLQAAFAFIQPLTDLAQCSLFFSSAADTKPLDITHLFFSVLW